MRILAGILLLFAILFVTVNVRAAGSEVQSFTEIGVLVALPAFFEVAGSEKDSLASKDGVSGLALVTDSGIYSFLETPTNAEQLKGLGEGSSVRVQGNHYTPGRLIEIKSIERTREKTKTDVDRFAADKGRKVFLEGENKCQCGLKVGSLEASCDLGHLHHLEAEDGKMYHYLQTGPAVNMFLGKGFHFKKVKVEALELPGQFLLVQSAEVTQ